MALFLNREKLNEWIPKIISEAERELVIITPYIKSSTIVYQHLREANERGVEAILVYREDQLSKAEKAKFTCLDNLNLFHHPNVHCKCYLSEKYLLISSMNMYEYSEQNNREMGVLFIKERYDSSDVYNDAVEEIRQIINSSQMEKKSRETIEEGFIVDIIKTAKQRVEDECREVNPYFLHKHFEAVKSQGGTWECKCVNYYDNINVIPGQRFELELTFTEDKLKAIFDKFTRVRKDEFPIRGYKLYWNYHTSRIMLYKDKRFPQWNVKTEKESYAVWQKGVDELVKYIRVFF